MTLSTHVLDAANGRPAAGVAVALEFFDEDDGWRYRGRGVTDADGRVTDLPTEEVGVHRLVFATAKLSAFFPEVAIAFAVADPGEHHHVPLLLSPFAYSTYRGS